MKIEKIPPKLPESHFSMEFTRDEGWAIVMALRDTANLHPRAQDVKKWEQWATELDKRLRYG